jgi:thiosulfate dehydrogenase [quinone] large subunit
MAVTKTRPMPAERSARASRETADLDAAFGKLNHSYGSADASASGSSETTGTTEPSSPSKRATALRAVTAITRISLGWVFLWAFLDKTFALGFGTGKNPETGAVDYFGDAAWINGGSPTKGFLSFGTKGPLADFYQGIAGAAWADWLFMLGLAGIGTALILGIGMRAAAALGSLLLVMMWSAVLPTENNPFMDDHLIYALVLIGLAVAGAGKVFGLGKVWERIPFVARHGILK